MYHFEIAIKEKIPFKVIRLLLCLLPHQDFLKKIAHWPLLVVLEITTTRNNTGARNEEKQSEMVGRIRDAGVPASREINR